MKFPEWWSINRNCFVMLTNLFFIPQKIKKPIQVIITLLDSIIENGKNISLKDVEITE